MSKANSTLTCEKLRELLHYDPKTGVFTWSIRSCRRFPGMVLGSKNGEGYIHFDIDKIKYKAHQLAWLYMKGSFPEHEIDHINGNPSDNRFENLRQATHAENGKNRKKNKNNTSNFKGVGIHKGRWRARIRVGYKLLDLGYFDTPEEAHAAYCLSAKQEHGEFFNAG